MSISIITPHFNDFKGLQRLYQSLIEQTNKDWEWIIVDDCSYDIIKNSLKEWYDYNKDNRIILIFNEVKSNASVCRNKGASASNFNQIVFIDADDTISADFVANRSLNVIDFIVFKNTAVIEADGTVEEKRVFSSDNYINYFLGARFIWPITSVLWNKTFFNLIGGFSPDLPRLQDVELIIRAMQISKDYIVINNKIDFFYHVKPIDQKTNLVKPICNAVKILITDVIVINSLTQHQKSLVKGFYFTCVRYFERVGDKEDVEILEHNLKLFYRYDYISIFNYVIGFCLIRFFKFGWLSGYQFLRFNRFLFKPKLFEN